MSRIHACGGEHHDRRRQASAATGERTRANMTQFFKDNFRLPFLEDPSTLMNVMTGSGVCTHHDYHMLLES